MGPDLPGRRSGRVRADGAGPGLPHAPAPPVPQERPVGELPDAVAPTLLEALGRLAPKDRAVLVLRYWEDRSVEETADAMNTGSAAIRTRTSRALDRLREQLGGDLTAFVDR